MSRHYSPEAAVPDSEDPFAALENWFLEAKSSEPELPEAAVLATVDEYGQPSSRVVLVRGMGPKSFDFYTNYHSRKARELEKNAKAALCFHWKSLGRQVRVEGAVTAASTEKSDNYWTGRPRGSQLGAWASEQSNQIRDRQALLSQLARVKTQFDGKEVPRPPHWGGYRLIPIRIELWAGCPDRLHERVEYQRLDTSEPWQRRRLQP